MDKAIPAFWPLSEALMAALASRSHEWKEWSLSEFQTGELQQVYIEVLTRDLKASSRLLSLEDSPSETVYKVLTQVSRESPPDSRYLKRSKNSRGEFLENQQK